MNVDKAMEIIDQIASKLGVAAEYIIPELARMQIVKLIIGIVASIIVLAVVCTATGYDSSFINVFSRRYRLCRTVCGACTFWRNQRIKRVDRVTNSAVHRVCDESIKISVSSRTMEE